MDSGDHPTTSVPPTEIDSDSDDQSRVPMDSDDPWQDSLIDALERDIEASSSHADQESLDSQLTQNENPNEPLAARLSECCASATTSGVHWSLTEDFIDRVGQVLAGALHQPWFRIAQCFDVMDLRDFQGCVNHAIQWIEVNRAQWSDYKIGITENPLRRWCNDDHGYAYATENTWNAMHIVYSAPTSKWKLHITETPESRALKIVSTGAMERALIREFKGTQGCVNRADGGDCPSDGVPHFVYVVANVF